MSDETNAGQVAAWESSFQQFSSEGISADVARRLERRGRPDSRSYLPESDPSSSVGSQLISVTDCGVRKQRLEEVIPEIDGAAAGTS